MKKTYTEPNFYYEDLELSTIVTGDFGGKTSAYHAEYKDGKYVPTTEVDDPIFELIYANSWSCIVYTELMEGGYGWWFSEKAANTPCTQENYNNAPHHPGDTTIYGFDCYHGPSYMLVNHASL